MDPRFPEGQQPAPQEGHSETPATRASNRVELNPQVPATIEVESSGKLIDCWVLNLSESGIAFLLKGEVHIPPPSGAFGRVRMTLPGASGLEQLQCQLRIAHLRSRGSHWYVGASFLNPSDKTRGLVIEQFRRLQKTDADQ